MATKTMTVTPAAQTAGMETCEFFLLIDEAGNFVVATDSEKLANAYDEEIGGTVDEARRVIKLTLKVRKPATLEVAGTVPDEVDGEIALTVG